MKLEDDRLCPDATQVASKIVDGEAIVIDLKTGTYYSLPGSGARVWGALLSHRTLTEIVAALVEVFDADPATVRADTHALLEQLAAVHMLATSTRGEPLPDEELWSSSEGADYEAPKLHTYDDMAELLALDPPTPGALENLMRKPLDEAGD